MKKVELHVHLDGSVRPETVSELLDIDVDKAKKEMIVESDNNSLSEYLTKFVLPIEAMQTASNLKRIAKELAEDLIKDDVVYAEVRFAPMFHTKEGLTFDEVVEAVLNGIKEVKGIKINLILCMMRGMDYSLNLKTIRTAERFLDKGVVALDLAGDEKTYKTCDYKELFKIAKEKNIPFTIHSGEADGIESINSAIEFGASRLGHGIRILESKDTVKNAIKNNIALEICPSSNIQTRVFDDFDTFPIKDLLNSGLTITINTDNRTVSNTTLEKEYEILKKECGITDLDLIKCNQNAIECSFLNDECKEKYKTLLKDF